MSVVNIFSGTFCNGEEVAQGAADRLGCDLVRDEDVIGQAARTSGLEARTLRRALFGKPSIFNQFSGERERSLAALKAAVAEAMDRENLVILGFTSQVVPRSIGHVLNVCLIAPAKARAVRAARELGITEKEALAQIHRDDQAAFRWVDFVAGAEPWESDRYDLRLDTNQIQAAEAIDLIAEKASDQVVAPTEASRRAVGDFRLAARVEAALAAAGHPAPQIQVEAGGGQVSILINKKVMMLNRLTEELEQAARSVEPEAPLEVKPGPAYYQADVYRKADFRLPSKVLLVDDEQEFAQTLSERLLMREIGSAVVHDGETALRVVTEDEPEVIVLDLKMPGLDGIEVLKRIKADHPEVEVIILTGHGSERDRETCMSLGAFAYLEKPVDINVLSETMQQAYDKARRS